MAERHYRLDRDACRHDRVVIGGSPLKLFRLTKAGVDTVERIVAGDPVPASALVTALLDAGAIHPIPVDASYTRSDITIVIPALGPPAQVPPGALVVDDGSEPPITDAAVRLEPTGGPAAARNAGLDQVTTSLVAFVDTDVTLPEDWLDALLPHFNDPRVALVAPRVASEIGTSRVARYESTHSPLDLGPNAARVRAGSRVSYVPAAAIVCRTDAIRAMSGFDARLRFGEDVDLVWRLDGAGWRVRYEPDSVVTHTPRADWLAWFRQRLGYGSSAAPLARRHRGALAPIRMSGWSLITWVAAVAVHPVVGVTIGAGSAAALVRKLDDVPPRDAFRLAWRGNLHAGELIASAIRRVWWPLLVVASVRSRAARRALVLACVAGGRPTRILDDVAYSIGVWKGMALERTVAPLVPEISSWPGRGSPSRGAAAR